MTKNPMPTTSRRSLFALAGVMGTAAAFAGTLSACGTSPSQRASAGASAGSSANPNGTIHAAI